MSDTEVILDGGSSEAASGEAGEDTIIVANVTTVDLGVLGIDTMATVLITNRGTTASGPLAIVASPGISVTGCLGPLAAGASCTLAITVASTSIGSYRGAVVLSAEPGAVTPLVITILAEVEGGGFAVSPTTIDLGRIASGVRAPQSNITITALGDIGDLAVTTTGPDVAIDKDRTTCTAVLTKGASCRVVVDFLAITAGSKSEAIVISSGGSTAGQVVTVPITALVTTGGHPLINPSVPQTLVSSAGGTSSPITFTIANAGDAPTGPITVAVTGADAAEFSATSTCTILAPLTGCTITVVFTPAATRVEAATATLTVTDTGSASGSVAVALVGLVKSGPRLTITSPTSDLGTVMIGLMGPATVFTVTNSADSATGMLEVTVSNPDHFILTNDTCTGTSLAKNGTCTVSVAFKAKTVGAKSATLMVSAAGDDPAVMTITGTGLMEIYAPLNPSSIDFGSVSIGTTSKPQAVSLRNTGGSIWEGVLTMTSTGNHAVFPLSNNTCTGAVSLSPGASCSFEISFAPAEVRNEVASFTISDGTFSSTVTVSGTGVP